MDFPERPNMKAPRGVNIPYIVFELDHENYQYSLVSGPDKSYL
jgi:lipocalin